MVVAHRVLWLPPDALAERRRGKMLSRRTPHAKRNSGLLRLCGNQARVPDCSTDKDLQDVRMQN